MNRIYAVRNSEDVSYYYTEEVLEQVEIQDKYEGYIKKQEKEALYTKEKFKEIIEKNANY